MAKKDSITTYQMNDAIDYGRSNIEQYRHDIVRPIRKYFDGPYFYAVVVFMHSKKLGYYPITKKQAKGTLHPDTLCHIRISDGIVIAQCRSENSHNQ